MPEFARQYVEGAISAGLKMAGLYQRGRRNALAVGLSRVQLSLPALPPVFDGYRILHISDVHGDHFPEIGSAVARAVRGVSADLCVLTGDYRFALRGPCEGVYPVLAEILADVRAPSGTLAVLGNHDSIQMLEPLDRLGVRVLLNESCSIDRDGESIWFAGLDDPHYFGCDDLAGALLDVPREAFLALLVHTPELAVEAAEAGVGLYLCGHTHGGQIAIPKLGPLMMNADCPRERTAGLWNVQGMVGYTSRGAGCSAVPIRFNCPPEVTLIELLSDIRVPTG